MKLTPADIQQQQFKIRFRGFDVREVDHYLEQVAQAFSTLLETLEKKTALIQRLQEEKQAYKEREETFKRVMLNSQKVLAQMKDNARRTAEVIVADAEVKAEKILNRAHNSLSQLHADMAELKRQRIQLEVQLRSVLEAHTKLLDNGLESVEALEQEEKALKAVSP